MPEQEPSDVHNGKEWQREQLKKYLNRAYHLEVDEDKSTESSIQVYITDTGHRHIEQHNTEYFSTDLPWEIQRLVRDGLVDISNVQFTIYHNEGGEKGDRVYKAMFMLSINWDSFTEEQDIIYWSVNITYP